MYAPNAPDPRFHVQMVENDVQGYEWPVDFSVTLTIDDPSNGPGNDFSKTRPVVPYDNNPTMGEVYFNDLGGLDLAPAMLVTMTNGTITKTHTVTDLVVTGVDLIADTVSGTGTPGANLNVQYCGEPGCLWRRWATVQPDGTWQADFSVAGPGDAEQLILDIVPGIIGEALEPDIDNDHTDYQWGVNIPIDPPLIIVHGFQGLSKTGGYHCSNDGVGKNDIQEYDGTNPALSTLGTLPQWFLNDYQVWIAHLESTPSSTPSLLTNAKCLSDQLDYVSSVNPNHPITIVAHSMGGLVSRLSLYNINRDTKIKALYTLGSPHAGFPFDALQLIYGLVKNQDAVYNMAESSMTLYNGIYRNKKGIQYLFIGGDGTLGGFGPLVHPFVGFNDGLVGKYSAVGWYGARDPYGIFIPLKLFNPAFWPNKSVPGQYWTNEFHVSGWGNGNNYYSPALDTPNDYSHAFECMNALMHGTTSTYCQDATAITALSQESTAQSSSSLSAFTELTAGHLNAGQSISIPLEIDTDTASLFYITWSGDKPTFTLTRPGNQLIDPDYANAHPSEVTYEDFAGGAEVPPNQTYNFNTTQSGNWQLNISTSSDIDYRAFAILDSSRSLAAQTDKDSYQIGDTATITANLDTGGTGLSGAAVTATLTRPDSVVDVVSLTDQGNGTYSNTYTIPDTSGYLAIDVTASGSDSGTVFSRQENLLVAIAPNELQLTGNYDDQPRDDNSDGFYDFLDFEIEANFTASGEYAVSAELYAGDQIIAQSGDYLYLPAGMQIVTLPFDGGSIREAGLNGPYTIKNLYFTPIDIGITAASAEIAWTTSAYSYTQFADKTSPQVSSIKRANPNPTSAASVNFKVKFSEPVTSVDTGDFALTTTGLKGASITGVSGSGSIRTVTVKTGSGNGTLRLDVVDDDTIRDAFNNALGGTVAGNGDYTAGETYTVQKRLSTRSAGVQDGWLLESTETSNQGGAMNSGAMTFNLGDNAANQQYRAILHFNTSSLPDNAVITKVVLKIKKQGLVSTNPFTTHKKIAVDISKGAFSNSSALQLTDFQAAADKNTAGLIANTPQEGGWYFTNINATGFPFINLTGVTQFRLRFQLDDNNDLGADFLKFFSGNATTAIDRPVLIVEYYVP
jgi:pimeloyl-ACP methyl ester carboxylesterase